MGNKLNVRAKHRLLYEDRKQTDSVVSKQTDRPASKGSRPHFYVRQMLSENGPDDLTNQRAGLGNTQKRLEKVNNALEFSNDHLHSIIEGTSDLIAALDLDYKIISFNSVYKESFENLVGRELHQGSYLHEMLNGYPDVKAMTIKMWTRALKGESFTSTYAIEINDHISYLEASYSPIKNIDNEVMGATTVIRNVTRRVELQEELHQAHESLEAKVLERTAELEEVNRQLRREIEERAQTEKLLLDSERKFKTVFENASVGMSLTDMEGNLLLVNSALCEMLGLPDQECQSMKLRDFLHKDYLDNTLKTERKLKSGEIATSRTTQKFVHKDGRIVWADVATILLKTGQGQKDYFISHIQDVTGQIQSKKRLMRERNLAEGIINSLPGIFYIFDKNGKLNKWNNNFEKITGYSAHEIPGKSILRLFDVDEIGLVKKSIRETFSGEESEVEANLVSKDGKKTPYYFTGTVTHNDGGPYFMGMGMDITDRKQAENEIKLYARKLKKLNASKDKLFSIIAHDLRSPFTGLIGLSDMLNKEIDTLSNKDIRSFAGMINKSANSIFQLLNNLLEWSKVQLNGTEVKPESINLKDLIDSCYETLQDNLRAKNIELNSEVDRDIQVMADRNMLVSVFQNLISNSLKFTNENGSIFLKVTGRDDHILAQVSDTGIGISDKVLKGIFTLDQSTSRKGTRNEQGSGLGLILCKEFVGKHGGEIWVESTEGVGST
ncbi:MAG: PAS domain S-box protein, partial [Balneolales bacterium]